MGTITCAKCKQQKAGFAERPILGSYGTVVVAHICPDCWKSWEDQQTKVINEYRINLADPRARAKLYELMEEFLDIKELCADL